MKIALLSDVHANLPALEAVLGDIDARDDVDITFHLGDLVGYAPWPEEVVEMIRERRIAGVAGNYDSTVGTDYKHCGCRYEDPRQEALSHESFAWTCGHCDAGTKRFLAGLPFRIDLRPDGGHAAGPTAVLVHATPTVNTLYWTEDRSDDFCRKMTGVAGLKPGDAIAFGHTHRAWHRVVDGIHLVNTGSVGRPKDGDPRAGYSTIDLGDGGMHVEHSRIEYDVERAATAIEASDLPREFAWYLRTGGTSLDAPGRDPAGKPR